MIKIVRVLLFSLLFLSATTFAALTSIEKNIRAQVQQLSLQQIEFLKQLVNINSHTNNVANVYRAGKIIQQQLQTLGFTVSWDKTAEKLQKAGTLIAERKGTRGKKLLLIAHLDTVPVSDKTFILKNKSAEGSGIFDDKGGIAIMLTALTALNQLHLLDNTQITIVLTGDEEDTGKPVSISRRPLLSAAVQKDIALDFEPSVAFNTATIARRGISNWKIISSGRSAHSAGIFSKDVGAGAILELCSVLDSVRLSLLNEALTFNVGLIGGGTQLQVNNQRSQFIVSGKQNVVANTAVASGDFRYASNTQKNHIKQMILSIANAHLLHTKSTVTFEDAMPPMPAAKNNRKLLMQYSEVSIDLGGKKITPVPLLSRGAGDISFVANKVPTNLSGLGATGFGAHTNNETIDLSTLPIQTARAAILIYRLTR